MEKIEEMWGNLGRLILPLDPQSGACTIGDCGMFRIRVILLYFKRLLVNDVDLDSLPCFFVHSRSGL